MAEPLSIAAQIHISPATFGRWLKQPRADGVKVLDALADLLDDADRNPDELFLCQFDVGTGVLLFFLGREDNLVGAAPVLELFETLAACCLPGESGYLAAGHHPCGALTEVATWHLATAGLQPVDAVAEGGLAQLAPLLERLIACAPEQHLQQKALIHRSIARHFGQRGNAGVRRATRAQPLWLGDDYLTDGQHVYWKCFQPQDDRRLDGAAPYHFRRLAGRLWGDDRHLYCDDRRLAELGTAPRVVGQVVLVAGHAYWADRDSSELRHVEVDPARFRRLGAASGYYTDDSQAWFELHPVPEQPQHLTIMAAGLARGRHQVYLDGRPYAAVAAARFRALGGGYYHDAAQLWYHDLAAAELRALGPAADDTATLDGPWCRDANGVWFDGQPLVDADPATFAPIHAAFCADAERAWCGCTPLTDPAQVAAVRAAWLRLAAR